MNCIFILQNQHQTLVRGNYMSTKDSANRTDMFYAVFRTPDNSMRASAVCAFQLSDIVKTFQGRFKGQDGPFHNWLTVPVTETPHPHPATCVDKYHPGQRHHPELYQVPHPDGQRRARSRRDACVCHAHHIQVSRKLVLKDILC